MAPGNPSPPPADLDDIIEAYESARSGGGPVDLAAFAPPPAHASYLTVLRELVRVDLEYGWRRGQPRPLEDYAGRFPELFRDRDCLREITFEEYRLRGQLGDNPSPGEYERRWGVDVGGWPPSGPPATVKVPVDGTPADADLPAVGTDFLDFHLVAELGRGAFGRVYLVRQKGLADRPVVLKVASNIALESRALAQLQHTNIVPVYSVHQAGALSALCMPYLGSTTLAHVLDDLRGRRALPQSGKELAETAHACKSTTRPDAVVRAADPTPEAEPVAWRLLERLTYVQAVLWLGARLADGLGHAHERGILHRDLKPANVLLTDDGQPMLLDFNLSEDTKPGAAAAAFVGGTLPYMPPEQLRAFRQRGDRPDARGDVYALGVILFELLTGRHPFPRRTGPLETVLAEMLRDRDGPAPRLRGGNAAVSPAVESIVRRCLEPDPGRRYQAARELQEDLQRQLDHRPLKYAPDPSPRERAGKWVRRHPRAAVASLAGVALALLVGLTTALVVRDARHARLEAAAAFQQFRDDTRQARWLLATSRPADRERLGEGLDLAGQALDRYRARTDPAWWEAPAVRRLPPADQDRLREEAGDLMLLLASVTAARAQAGEPVRRPEGLQAALDLNRLADSAYPDDRRPALVGRQRASLARLLDPSVSPPAPAPQPAAEAPQPTKDLCLAAQDLAGQGKYLDALPRWRQAVRQDPTDLWAWAGLAACYENLARFAEAAACYDTCSALAPNLPWLCFKRGVVHLQRHDYADALADFDRLLADRPDVPEGYINRALAWQGLKKDDRAIQDVSRAIELGTPQTRVYFIRAMLRARAGDRDGAGRDRAEGLRREPTDELSCVVRGLARLASDPNAALADFDKALRLNPRSLDGLQNKASVLSEQLNRPHEAVAALDRAVELYPDFVPARAGRGVLLARLGKRREAHRDAEECLGRDVQPATLYQVAGIYALTSRQQPDDREEAILLLSAALRKGYGRDLLAVDTDLDPIRDHPDFRRLTAKARAPAGGQ
jgi:serine/threonine protein kinase/tetratricopeptide (TPR) repeat protein